MFQNEDEKDQNGESNNSEEDSKKIKNYIRKQLKINEESNRKILIL